MDLFNKEKTRELEWDVMQISAKSDAATRELIEVKALNLQILQQQQTLTANLTDRITQINQNIAQYPSWDVVKQAARYSTTDDIYSIIRLIATTAALIPLYSYQITNDKAFAELHSIKGHGAASLIQKKQLQKKALTELADNDKLYDLLEHPHLFLSKFEFHEAIHTLLPLQGECILYKMRSEFGVNEGLTVKLEFLESQNVIRKVSGFPHQITSYDYVENGIVIMRDIPPEDIIHIRYYKGFSPLQALHRRLQRMDSEMDVSVAQLQNGGVPGILYDKSDDPTQDVPTSDGGSTTIANQRKDNFYRYLQNKSNKGAPFMDAGDLGYIELGLKLADMEVAELSKIDFKKLCNAFGVSDVLFNNDAASTESNIKVQETRLYTNTVLPNVYRVRDALIAGLVPEFSKDNKKRTIKEDLTEITALQGDMLKMAQAYAALPSFVPNEMREMFHLERDEDPNADKIYVKTGYVALEDLQGSADLPISEDFNKP